MPPLLKMYTHPLIQEIRYHPDWLAWKAAYPVEAIAFLEGIIRDLPWQWENLLKYKAMRRAAGHTEIKIADGVEAAVMPEVYQRWMEKLQPEGIPAKYFINEFITNHRELWDDKYNWTKDLYKGEVI